MARCLVLGGNGFIGSHLVDHLVEVGHEVRAFDRFSGEFKNFQESDAVEVFAGDFLNRRDLAAALRGIEYVFHFISTTTPITAEDDPLVDIETNVKQSVVLFQECARQDIKKVIFASTGGAIYGDNSSGRVSEDYTPQPVSPYAIGKLTIEHYLHYFAKKHGLQSLVFRISNPYGERQSLTAKQGVIPIFLRSIAQREPVTILGDGSMVRDYIYVKDVARMVAGTFQHTKQSVYNLGSGIGTTLNQLIPIMEDIAGHPVKSVHKNAPLTFVKSIVLDTSRFTEEFNMRPEVELEDGIKYTWGYIQKVLSDVR